MYHFDVPLSWDMKTSYAVGGNGKEACSCPLRLRVADASISAGPDDVESVVRVRGRLVGEVLIVAVNGPERWPLSGSSAEKISQY